MKLFKSTPAARASSKAYYHAHKESCKATVRAYKKNMPEAQRENGRVQHRAYMARLTRNLRLQIYDLYGQQCACCGIVDYEFLSIDHVCGGGRKEKAQFNQVQYLEFVLGQGFKPEKYQILCHNCNQAKGFYGFCPHALRP